MPEKKEPTGGGARGTARRRRSLAANRDGGGISRPLLVAAVLILAGAAYLFWPRGSESPGGIGEQLTVVTADSTITAAPRSGNVEIQDEQQAIVPEQPADRDAQPATAVDEPAAEPTEQPARTEPATPEPDPEPRQETRQPVRQTTPPPPPPPRIEPRATGSWAVQVGAFQTEANANALVQRLADKDIAAHVRAAGTSSGEIVYRVWVGWFQNRQTALDYGKQERRIIGDSYPVHR